MKTAGVYTISYDSTIESGYDNPGLAFQIEDVVQVWIDTYMHMSDYDKDGELGSTKGTGLCSGYYDLAKPALLALGSDAVTHFSGDTASKYTAALARYNEWARIKKDANPFNSGDASNVIKVSETNNNTTIAIVAVSAISLIAIGSFFFIRKKKESK